MTTKEELTDLQQLLLDVLERNSDWMTRSQIADAIERPNRLNPHDVSMLDDMAEKGIIDVTERKIGAVKTEYIYKAK
jgi:hypothetical protein